MTKAVAELDAAMAEATKLRQEEKEKNTQTIKDAQEAQTAVAQALTVLKEFYAKASGRGLRVCARCPPISWSPVVPERGSAELGPESIELPTLNRPSSADCWPHVVHVGRHCPKVRRHRAKLAQSGRSGPQSARVLPILARIPPNSAVSADLGPILRR